MKRILTAMIAGMLLLPTVSAQTTRDDDENSDPVSSEVTVTLLYIGEGLGSDVYKKVHTTAEAFAGSFVTPVDVDSDTYTFTCIPPVGLNFEPYDDYYIKSFTSSINDPEFENIQGGKYQHSITLFGGAPSEVTLTIEIAAEESTSVETITKAEKFEVTTLEGIRLETVSDRQGIRQLPAGLYIVNGKKIIIK